VDGFGERHKISSPNHKETPSTVHKGSGLALRLMSASPSKRRVSPSNR